MTLNYIWIAFFILSFFIGLIKFIWLGDTLVFKDMVENLFSTTRISVMEIALPLAGMMSFWLGIMKIGENAGAIRFLSKLLAPFFSKLFPSIPKKHPAIGNMVMNLSANLLGLDNAATPLGLKAMDSLQELNLKKDTASDSQIMFLTLHVSGLTLIPATIMLYRYLNNASDPTDIFIPCIVATFCTTLIGIFIVAIKQKLNLLNLNFLGGMLTLIVFIFSFSYFMKFSAIQNAEKAETYIAQNVMPYIHEKINIREALLLYPIIFQKQINKNNIAEISTPDQVNLLNQEYINFERGKVSRVLSNALLLFIPVLFISGAYLKKVNVFESFIDGAKDGFRISVKIIPYLVAMLAVISLLRTSGIMEFILMGLSRFFEFLKLKIDFIPALPVALMKPLSGSGSRALMIETMQIYGSDSFPGRLACIFQGSADTTFYIIALYFGSIGIKKIRYSITVGLLTEFLGAIVAVGIAYYFFG